MSSKRFFIPFRINIESISTKEKSIRTAGVNQ